MKTLTLILVLFIMLIIFLTPYSDIDLSRLNYNISGCAKEGYQASTKAPIKPDEITIESINGTLNYYRFINHQCCLNVTLEKEVNNSIINITETWTGEGCKCMCSSEINATIIGLKKGEYKLNVYSGNETLAQVQIRI